MNNVYILKETDPEGRRRSWAFTSAERAVKFIQKEGWENLSEYIRSKDNKKILMKVNIDDYRPADLARSLKSGKGVSGELKFSGNHFMIESMKVNPIGEY